MSPTLVIFTQYFNSKSALLPQGLDSYHNCFDAVTVEGMFPPPPPATHTYVLV